MRFAYAVQERSLARVDRAEVEVEEEEVEVSGRNTFSCCACGRSGKTSVCNS